jgi:hypothetical protein
MTADTLRVNVSRMRQVLGRARDWLTFPTTERAENPYATHLPVLVGISRLLSVKRVAEFGCGRYSTLTFLDRSVFPDLVALHSFEDDPGWREEIAAMTRDDPRMRLTAVAQPMSEVVARIALQEYDLVFVDDSTHLAGRAATIREVACRCGRTQVVIMHDYEQRVYRKAARPFRNRFAFATFNPSTGVAWNGGSLDKAQLRRQRRTIQRYAARIGPEDRGSWMQVFHENS